MQSLNFLLAAAIAAACPTAIHSQTGNWQIDPEHSTASLNLTSSTNAGRPYNLAIAMVAGRLDVDTSKPAHAVVSLSIFPSGQGSDLLTKDGAFRSGTFGTLTKYTLLSFQSERASPCGPTV
jgi:polyisoprenoid-binding protein YceI